MSSVSAAHKRRATWEAVILSTTVLFVVGAAIFGLWLSSRQSAFENFRLHLTELAQEAATSIDPVLHEQIRRPEQLNDADYVRAVEPLRRIRKALPAIHYAYTVVKDGEKIHFILDAADPTARAPNGHLEQSGVWEIYEHRSPTLGRALGIGQKEGEAAAGRRLARDEWGAFMTGAAPLRNAAGKQIGAVGLDVDATVLSSNLDALRNRALLGLAPAGVLIVICGVLFFRVRCRGLADGDAALKSASALIKAAQADRLTGLPNRTVFMEHLEAALSRVRSRQQAGFAVLFFDFDRFKVVNDTLGHEAGDELLRQISRRLADTLRVGDLFAQDADSNLISRFGGDEFLILVNNLRAPADAVRVAERLLNALAPGYSLFDHEVSSMASVGIVTSDQCSGNAEEVVRNADFAMYEAKRAGRGCSVMFSEAMHARMARHLAIETSLRRAIGTDELSLTYAPVVELQSGKVGCVEAVLQWTHPTMGQIATHEFMPIAEESGLMVALGQWVLQEACQAMAGWRAGTEKMPARVSLRISRSDLARVDKFVEQVCGTLESIGLPPHCLQLEVSEFELVQDAQSVSRLMTGLQELGVTLGLRDFGAGHCSLSVLREFPFDTIKIDRSFAEDLREGHAGLAVVGATLSLIRNLGKQSVAVGVEDATQVAVLQSLGCDCGQGPWFGELTPTGGTVSKSIA